MRRRERGAAESEKRLRGCTSSPSPPDRPLRPVSQGQLPVVSMLVPAHYRQRVQEVPGIYVWCIVMQLRLPVVPIAGLNHHTSLIIFRVLDKIVLQNPHEDGRQEARQQQHCHAAVDDGEPMNLRKHNQ